MSDEAISWPWVKAYSIPASVAAFRQMFGDKLVGQALIDIGEMILRTDAECDALDSPVVSRVRVPEEPTL